MIARFYQLTNNVYCDAIYKYNMEEDLRKIITKWRLSSHNLEIEMGRRKGIARELRHCSFCVNCIEDETHVVYHCPAYEEQRLHHRVLLEENNTIKMFLNPKDKTTATNVGKFLKIIEKIRDDLL